MSWVNQDWLYIWSRATQDSERHSAAYQLHGSGMDHWAKAALDWENLFHGFCWYPVLQWEQEMPAINVNIHIWSGVELASWIWSGVLSVPSRSLAQVWIEYLPAFSSVFLLCACRKWIQKCGCRSPFREMCSVAPSEYTKLTRLLWWRG